MMTRPTVSRAVSCRCPLALGALTLLAGAVTLFAHAAAHGADSPAADPLRDHERPFLVFSAMMHQDRPDMRQFGMHDLTIVYAQDLWDGRIGPELPRENAVRTVIRRVHRWGNLLCLNIEHWLLHDEHNELREDNLRKYAQVADWVRAVRPGVRLGFYAMLPPRLYDPFGRGDQRAIDLWEQRVDDIKPLAEYVDVVFPSLYALSDDIEVWQRFAEANIAAARRYGRPVYAFLWPRFHTASNRPNEPIPGEFWRTMLETCREHADGLVIWGGYLEPWEDDAEWWQETEAFMASLRER